MTRRTNDPMRAVAGLALVAPRTKILYLAIPKAACTTIKLMLATAEGTHRPDLASRLAVMHVSHAQTIHHPRVNGLAVLADLPSREQRDILESSDWLRIASVRDPVSRIYSAWENRIFMRAHRRTTTLIELAHDVLTNDRIDIAASFAHFAKVLGANADPFMADHHFQPQAHLVRPDLVNYNRLVRVDQPGQIDDFARVVSERSGRSITAERLNEGLGISVERVCDVHTANRLMATYAADYGTFGFERRTWPATVEPLLLDDMQTRLLAQYRNAFERAITVAREAQRRTGARYGMSQIRRAIQKVLRGDGQSIEPREIM